MKFTGTSYCCTANLFENLPTWGKLNDQQKLKTLKDAQEMRTSAGVGQGTYKTFIAFCTNTQYKDGVTNAFDFLVNTLGFKEVFVGEYRSGCRHPETGDLHVFCIHPQDFIKNIKDAIVNITEKATAHLKPCTDPIELKRRSSFPQFKITEFNKKYGTGYGIYEYIPNGSFGAGKFAMRVNEYTGGYDPRKDPYFEQLYKGTYRYEIGKLKSRAIAWRNGEFSLA